MIRWVFLDVGNVLFNDDPLMVFVYTSMFEEIRRSRPGMSFFDLMSERERLIREGCYGHYSLLALRYLDEKTWETLHQRIREDLATGFAIFNRPIPGVREALVALHQDYHLGIAANQMSSCRPLLAERSLLPYFSCVLISEEIGLSKPDSRFFQRMIQETGASPAEIAMVGDRIDNDIAPARRAGMRTVWLRMDPFGKGYYPESGVARAYLESLSRSSLSTIPPRAPTEEPDQVIQSPIEILPAVQSLHF